MNKLNKFDKKGLACMQVHIMFVDSHR